MRQRRRFNRQSSHGGIQARPAAKPNHVGRSFRRYLRSIDSIVQRSISYCTRLHSSRSQQALRKAAREVLDAAIRRAEYALYAAKAGARNRVECAVPPLRVVVSAYFHRSGKHDRLKAKRATGLALNLPFLATTQKLLVIARWQRVRTKSCA